MARLIPNQNTWVGFATTVASGSFNPTQAEVNAAVNLTQYLISLNASSQGNVVPTPAFDTLFETTIVGTSQASFTADFYRDSTADTAWTSLPRTTTGYFIISRFGGSGTGKKPQTGDKAECWPVAVVSRSSANLANNTVQTFTVTCSVPLEPNENATIA